MIGVFDEDAILREKKFYIQDNFPQIIEDYFSTLGVAVFSLLKIENVTEFPEPSTASRPRSQASQLLLAIQLEGAEPHRPRRPQIHRLEERQPTSRISPKRSETQRNERMRALWHSCTRSTWKRSLIFVRES